jgi:DNA-binding CsgD family transcriptional regulator
VFCAFAAAGFTLTATGDELLRVALATPATTMPTRSATTPIPHLIPSVLMRPSCTETQLSGESADGNRAGTEDLTEHFAAARHAARPLLERERELARLDSLANQAMRGRGRAMLVEGPAGIGKSRLLAETRAAAVQQGFDVLAARGGELERDHGFGVVKQLLEPPLARAAKHERRRLLEDAAGLAPKVLGAAEAPPLGDEHSALHGLYWLTANLCEQKPTLIVVDDLQWVDGPSLRFLVHLIRRLDGLQLGVALAIRTGDPSPNPDLVRALMVEVTPPLLRPRPLSPPSIAVLAEAALGHPPDPEVSRACADASAGNPFLLVELLESMALDARDGGLTAAHVRAFAPDRVSAAVTLRLKGHGSEAVALARAVAVLGQSATLANAAALARVQEEDARDVAATLARAEIFTTEEPLGFVHPLVRAAVYEELPLSTRRKQHRRAAVLLADAGAAAESVALHLMHVEPAGDEAAVGMLREAAVAAISQGATETAVGYLRRALTEPPAPELRAELLAELGFAATRAGEADALSYLEEAFSLTKSQPQRASVGLRLLAAGAASATHQQDVADVLARALEGTQNSELPPPLEAMAVLFIVGMPALRPRFGERVRRVRIRAPNLPAALLSSVATDTAISGGSASEAARLAQRALAGGELMHQDIEGDAALAMPAIFTLIDTGRLRAAVRLLDGGVAMARASGSRFALVRILAERALAHYRCGALPAAESDARECHELAGEPGWGLALALAAAVLAAVHVERGEPGQALQALAPTDAALGIGESLALQFLRESRVRTLIACGEPEAALVLLEDFERWTCQRGVGIGVELMSWRSLAALAYLRLGGVGEARRLAEEEIQLARRFGAAPKLGTALVAAGLAHDDCRGTDLLRRAVRVLAQTDARLEHARAVVELGSRKLRGDDLGAARELLAEGMDQAHRCRAQALVEQAHGELLSAGARPRRLARTGPDALTPSELRISGLAARGMSNKQIAQSLFLTIRTVEMHLSNAYRRLEISSRGELASALEPLDGVPISAPAA